MSRVIIFQQHFFPLKNSYGFQALIIFGYFDLIKLFHIKE